MPRSRSLPPAALLAGLLLTSLGTVDAQEDKANYFNDPFLRATSGIAECPTPQGPAITKAQMLAESHYRADRGVNCYQAGRCRLPNSYLYDQEIVPRVKKAIDATGRYDATTSVWIEGQRRWVWLEGCVRSRREADELEVLVRGLDDVEAVVNQLEVRPTSEPLQVEGDGLRLEGRVFGAASAGPNPALVVVLHGDAPRTKPSYQYAFAAQAVAASAQVVAVALLRPGYADPQGLASQGERGRTTGDNYNARNTDAIAAAIDALKARYHARKVVLVGHSGGAAIAANLLGRHPHTADAALLAACPCDVSAWRASMYALTRDAGFVGPLDTLSPLDQVGAIPERLAITLVVGRQDAVTPPRLSEAYRQAALRLGKRVQLIELEGKAHEILLDPEVGALLPALLGD